MSYISPFDYKYTFKYILVGNSTVGKSCILLRFTDSRFENNHEVTIGVEFGSKIIPIAFSSLNHQPTHQSLNVKIHVWDTAGQEAFKSITRSYYSGAACVLLVFDICNRESFNDIKTWLKDIKNNTNNPQIQLVLVGNKLDLLHRRTISHEEALRFANQNNMMYYEVSAKTGEHVNEAFQESAYKIYQRLVSTLEENNTGKTKELPVGIKLNPEQNFHTVKMPHQYDYGRENENSMSVLCCSIM